MTSSLRKICRLVRRPSVVPPETVFASVSRRALRSQTLIRVFYVALLYFAAWSIPEFAGLAQPRELSLLWPVGWLAAIDQVRGFYLILGFFLGASLAAAIWPGSRGWRVAVLAGWLCFVALKNSEGKIGHSLHLPVLVAMMFVFLPRGWERANASRPVQMSTLQVLAAAQGLVLLTYTMSGLGKLGGGLYEWMAGQAHPFQIDGFSRIVAERLLQTNSDSVLGRWIIEHPWLGGLLLPGAIYLQTTSILAAFRPSLHRVWGAALILFHLGNAFILTIYFPHSIFLLGLLLLASPFAPAAFDVRRILADLPILSVFSRVLPTREATSFSEVSHE
jgi:hypothetical protein